MIDEPKADVTSPENIRNMANMLFDYNEEAENAEKHKPLVKHALFNHKFSDYGVSSKDIIPLYLTKLNET